MLFIPRGSSQLLCLAVCMFHQVPTLRQQLSRSYTQAMLSKYPDAPVLLAVLPSFNQYVVVLTRLNKIIDLCYSNIPKAYKAKALPLLGLVDYNVICLLPVYKHQLKQCKPVMHSIRILVLSTSRARQHKLPDIWGQ